MPKERINYKGIDIDVHYYYYPGEPEVRYDSDGSGSHGCAESIEIDKIMLGKYDITELFEDNFEKIEEVIYDRWRNSDDY